MVSLNRRALLVGCGAASFGIASAGLRLNWDDVRFAANETPLEKQSGILVLVTMYGGNDGINTVVPYAQDAYYEARPELAYSEDEILDLDGSFGLNPGMTGLANLYASGKLAVVRGVGYPDQDRSHFRSMDIWQAGSVDNEVNSGWIGRWLDSKEREPLRAVSIGNLLPTLAIGTRATAATLSPASLSRSGDYSKVLSLLGNPDASDSKNLAAVRASYVDTVNAANQLKPLATDAGENSDSREALDPDTLDSQLEVVSRCIKAGLPTQVYCVSLGGFDTHSSGKATQQKLLQKVDRAITGFLDSMSANEYGENVVVMAYSEFGRRVAANASDGTDHGTSGPVLIAGAPVRGGMYGDEPSLTDLTQGDLKTTTDFRDVYAELLAKTLKTDPDPIVGSKRKPIGFLA